MSDTDIVQAAREYIAADERMSAEISRVTKANNEGGNERLAKGTLADFDRALARLREAVRA